MNDNPHNNPGFDETECLSEQQMLDYNSNKLSPREKHLVERHTLDCEMCADALEGFAMITDHSKVDETVFAVNAMISNEPAETKKRGWWDTRMKVAASVAILVLLGSVYYFQREMKDQTDNAFAQNFEVYPVPPAKQEQTGDETKPDPIITTGKISTQPEGSATENQQAPAMASRQLNSISQSESKMSNGSLDDLESPKAAVSGEGIAFAPNATVVTEEAEDANLNEMPKEELKLAAGSAKDEAQNVDAKKPSLVLDNVASTAGNTNNSNNYTITNGASGTLYNTNSSPATYTWSTGSSVPTTTFSSPVQTLSSKADQLLKSSKKSNDNTLARSNSKNTPGKPGADTETSKAKEKKAELRTEQPAGTYETTVADESEKELNEKSTMADTVTSSGMLTRAIQKYEAGRHSEAVPLFEQVLSTDPSNTQALFYSSVSYLSLNKPEKAIVNLDKVLASKDRSFYEPA